MKVLHSPAGIGRQGSIGSLAVVLALAAATRGVAQQVSVDQLELHIVMPKAGSAPPAPQTFRVINSGATPSRVTIAAQDWDRDLKGANRFYELNSLPTSCGARVRVFPSVLQLGPKSQQAVRVTVDSADRIAKGCYAILFVETALPLGADKPSVGITYNFRYGVKVYVERDVDVAAEIESAELAMGDSALARRDSSLRQVALLFHNTGGRQTMTRGTLEIRRPDNSLADRVDIPEFPTLPGAMRQLNVSIPRLPRGKYVVLALLDYGGSEIAAAQVELDIR
jgi:hypothetical protein